MEIHVVSAGETLYSIAGQYGIDLTLLRTLNGIPPDDLLAVGQTLLIRRAETFHIVQPGETADEIAQRYGLSLRQLYRNNYDLGGQPALRAGQALVIAYQDTPSSETVTNGYAYPFIPPALLTAELPYMSCLTPFTYGITADGGLLPLADETLLAQARSAGTLPLMHLSTLTESDYFSSERAVELLTSPARQELLTAQILATIEAKGYQGLDVDFEYIPAAQREAYAAFVNTLRERLAPVGLPVIVALAPKTYAQQPGLLYEAHDYALLGAAADFVLLMTYEWKLLAHALKPLANKGLANNIYNTLFIGTCQIFYWTS